MQRGNYSIAAIAVDGSDIPTVSPAVKFIVGKRPEVTIISPGDAARVSASKSVSIAVWAKQANGSIRRVDFYSDEKLIGSASDIVTETFSLTWRNVPAGKHTLRAVAVDDLGLNQTSKPITFSVEKTTRATGIND